MPMSCDFNEKTPPSASLHLSSHCQVFTRSVCCVTRNTLSTFFCSGQIIANDNAFSNFSFLVSFDVAV